MAPPSRCVEAEPQSTQCELKFPQACTQTDCMPSASKPGMHMQMRTPGCWWRRRGGGAAPRRGTLGSYFLEFLYQFVLRVRDWASGWQSGHAGGADRGNVSLLFATVRVVTVVRMGNRISTWNPAPRSHRADKASLGRLERVYRITPRPDHHNYARSPELANLSLNVSLLSASLHLCILFATSTNLRRCCTANPPTTTTVNVSLLSAKRKTDAKERSAWPI
jgi:hypothetical protein